MGIQTFQQIENLQYFQLANIECWTADWPADWLSPLSPGVPPPPSSSSPLSATSHCRPNRRESNQTEGEESRLEDSCTIDPHYSWLCLLWPDFTGDCSLCSGRPGCQHWPEISDTTSTSTPTQSIWSRATNHHRHHCSQGRGQEGILSTSLTGRARDQSLGWVGRISVIYVSHCRQSPQSWRGRLISWYWARLSVQQYSGLYRAVQWAVHCHRGKERQTVLSADISHHHHQSQSPNSLHDITTTRLNHQKALMTSPQASLDH